MTERQVAGMYDHMVRWFLGDQFDCHTIFVVVRRCCPLLLGERARRDHLHNVGLVGFVGEVDKFVEGQDVLVPIADVDFPRVPVVRIDHPRFATDGPPIELVVIVGVAATVGQADAFPKASVDNPPIFARVARQRMLRRESSQDTHEPKAADCSH